MQQQHLNKNIFLGGADGALGRETLRYLCDQGFRVVATAFNETSARELNAWMAPNKASQPPLILPCDLADAGQVSNCIAKALTYLGTIHGLVNTAGGFTWSSLADIRDEQFDFLVHANVRSNWLLLKQLAPYMSRQQCGRIILISAASTLQTTQAGFGVYAGSKRFLNSLIEAAAAEHGPQGVRVYGILPTIIDTPRNRADMPTADTSKWVPPITIATLIADLLTDRRAAENGELITIGN